MKTFFILLITAISPLYHPMKNARSEIIGFLFNAVDEHGRKYGITFGFFRGKFLTFSLKATLIGVVYYHLKYADYEAKVFLRRIKREDDTIWYKDSFIKVKPQEFDVSMRTPNYQMFFNVFPNENACERMMESAFKGEFYLPVMPVSMTGSFTHSKEFTARVTGRGFIIHLWSQSSIRLRDYLLFNSGKKSGFFEIDVEDGSAKGILCEEGELENKNFAFKITRKGRGMLTERLYPTEGILGDGEIVFSVRSTSDEIKMFRYSYLLSPVKVKTKEYSGEGFFISHPLKEEKRRERWEF